MSLNLQSKNISQVKDDKHNNNELFNAIKQKIAQFENWDESSLNINLPKKNFDKKEVQGLAEQLNTFVSQKSLDELESVSKDNNGKRIKLNEEQFNQIKKTATFEVPSNMFEGKNHIWQLSPYLQKGEFKINNDRQVNLANNLERILINFPNNLIDKNTNLSSINGVQSFAFSINQLLDKFVGLPKQESKYSDSQIIKLIDKERLAELLTELNINDLIIDSFLDDQLVIVDGNGNMVDLIIENNNQYIRNLVEKYNKYLEEWNTCKVERRNNILNQLVNNNPVITYNEAKKIIYEEEYNNRKKIIEILIKENIPHNSQSTITEYIKSKELIREKIRNRLNSFDKDFSEYKIKLEEDNPILNKIEAWRKRKYDEFKKEWNNLNSIEETYLNINSSLNCQYKYLFNNYINFQKSDKPSKIKKQFEKIKKPSKTFEWEFLPIKGKKSKVVSTSTKYFGWRVVNTVFRGVNWLYNGVNYLIKDTFFGNFGIRSLFGVNEFENNDEYIKTWFGRIKDLCNNIADSRKDFLNKPDNGFLGKTVTNIGNIIWNYAFKGMIGIPLILIGHPIITLLKTCVFTGLVSTSFLWAPIGSLLVYIINILFYDFEGSDKDIWFLPFLNIIAKEMFVKGIGRIIMGLILAFGNLIVGSLGCIISEIKTIIQRIFDKLMFELIIKNFSKVPCADSFSAKRVSGPELSKDHYYQLSPEMALILMGLHLEELEMNTFEKYCEKYISEKENMIIKFYNDFENLGFKLNESSEPYKSVHKTKQNLIKKIRREISEYNSNLINLNNIKSKRVKLSNTDLNKTLNTGTIFCKKFIEEKIFIHMTEEEIRSFWQKYSVFENDWFSLTKNLLSMSINKDILTPIELTDDDGFKLNINPEKIKTIFNNLFENVLDPLEKYDVVVPNIKTEDFNMEIEDINPNNWNRNIFAEEEYIKLNIPKNYNQNKI